MVVFATWTRWKSQDVILIFKKQHQQPVDIEIHKLGRFAHIWVKSQSRESSTQPPSRNQGWFWQVVKSVAQATSPSYTTSSKYEKWNPKKIVIFHSYGYGISSLRSVLMASTLSDLFAMMASCQSPINRRSKLGLLGPLVFHIGEPKMSTETSTWHFYHFHHGLEKGVMMS